MQLTEKGGGLIGMRLAAQDESGLREGEKVCLMGSVAEGKGCSK